VDLLVWLGDLNYRLVDLTQEEAKGLIASRQWGSLRACDQLAGEMAQGRAFAFMREGPLVFPPTYKFDRGTTKPMGQPPSPCGPPFPAPAPRPFPAPAPTRPPLLPPFLPHCVPFCSSFLAPLLFLSPLPSPLLPLHCSPLPCISPSLPCSVRLGEKRRVPAWCDRVLLRDSFCTALPPAPAPGGTPVALASLSGALDYTRTHQGYAPSLGALDSSEDPFPGGPSGHSDGAGSGGSGASFGSVSGNSSSIGSHYHYSASINQSANNHSNRTNNSNSNSNSNSNRDGDGESSFTDPEPLERDSDRRGSSLGGYPPIAKEFAVERASSSSTSKLSRKDLQGHWHAFPPPTNPEPAQAAATPQRRAVPGLVERG